MAIIDYLIGAQYGPVSDIEVVWTAIAAVGLTFAIWNARDARKSLKALPASVQNGRRALAILGVRMEYTRIVIQTIFVSIGLMALTIPDHVDQATLPLKLAILGAQVRYGFVIVGILVLYQSYANWTVRKHLLADGLVAELRRMSELQNEAFKESIQREEGR